MSGLVDRIVGRIVEAVTTHSKVVIAAMLVLTLVVGFGATSMAGPGQDELGSDTTEQQKLEYVQNRYDTGSGNVSSSRVYVRNREGNVLTREALLETLRFQKAVMEDDRVSPLLASDRPVIGLAPIVAQRVAGDPGADVDDQIAAIEAASEEEVSAVVQSILGPDSELIQLLPGSYAPGTASAESRWMSFRLTDPGAEASSEGSILEAERAILEHIEDREGGAEYFTFSTPVNQDLNQRAVNDTLELIGPIALLFILLTLAFAYRDLLDVIVGMAGVVLTLVWQFGIIGWLDVPFGTAAIIAPILMIGLSIDYGIHVFMRYREERGPDDGIRDAMDRGVSGVGVALVLVTLTTGIGFLSNLTNPLSQIRSLAIGTSIGVTAALIVFITVVPALKIELDGLLERFGLDRRKRALGTGGGRVGRFLTIGTRLARFSAVGVILVALLAGAGGMVAWGELDKSISDQPEQPADWKQNLPEPFAVGEYPFFERLEYVQSTFQRSGPDFDPAQVLIEGEVTDPAMLERLAGASADLRESDVVFRRDDGTVPIQSPLVTMQAVAASDEEFRAVLQEADEDGDGVPDRNVEAVYDALYAAAPAQAARVIERRDGEYRSVRLVVPTRGSADFNEVASATRGAATTIEREDKGLVATATGFSVIVSVQVDILTDNILLTLLVSLLAIFLLLMAIYRLTEGSALLGAVTVLPIALVVAWVFGAMYLFEVPLTLFTALMLSLAIGLGVDYSIHMSERFAQELPDASSPAVALDRAIRGTGGALLGSTATTVGAFSTLSLSTFPDVRQLGIMVALALVFSFVASVFVLPSLLTLWARHFGGAESLETTQTRASPDSPD